MGKKIKMNSTDIYTNKLASICASKTKTGKFSNLLILRHNDGAMGRWANKDYITKKIGTLKRT